MRLTVQNYGYCVLCVFLAVLAKSVLFVSWIPATWCLKSAKDLQGTLHSSQDDLLAKLCGLLAERAPFWPNSRLLGPVWLDFRSRDHSVRPRLFPGNARPLSDRPSAVDVRLRGVELRHFRLCSYGPPKRLVWTIKKLVWTTKSSSGLPLERLQKCQNFPIWAKFGLPI